MKIERAYYGLTFTSAILMPSFAIAEPHLTPTHTPSAITFRATSALPDAVIAFIANNGLPTVAVLPAGATPESLIVAACGSNTNTYQASFISFNKHLVFLPTNVDRTVALPACAKWKWNAQVNVREGDNIASLLNREIGRAPNDVLEKCNSNARSDRCDKTFLDLVSALNPGTQPLSLTPGSQLKLPVVSQWTTIRLDPAIWPNPLAFSLEITKIASTVPGSSVIINRPATSIHLINPVEESNLGLQVPACRDPTALLPHSWPFLVDDVADTIKRDAAFDGDASGRATIAILDTGLAGLGSRTFPSRWFVRNTRAVPGALTPAPGQVYAGDVYGVSVSVQTGAIEPNMNYEWPFHGTEVADMALGGFRLRRRYQDLAKYVGLKIVNVVSARTPDNPDIEESEILAGIRYAYDQGAAVANLSITSSMELEEIKSTLGSRSQLLVVAAAGNDTSNITLAKAFPASYGGIGPLGDQIISVAAVDSEYKLSLFSNYSASFVDIAAPGCAIPFRDLSGKETKISGTSFAAPLVSFTAALLHRFGLLRPRDIKNRLYASADYRPGLRVRSEGVLNIRKALAIHDDVLETKNGISTGTLAFAPDETFCDNTLGASDVVKISSVAGGAQLRIGFYDANGAVEFQDCAAPESDGISFTTSGKRQNAVKWADIVDLVPRLPGPRG